MDTKRFPFYVTERLSEHMYETPEGFLVCADVPVARIGEYIYKSSEVPIEGGVDGTVKIMRDEDEVFSEKAIKSFNSKPVTINHPNDFVTPENWKSLAHGTIQNTRRGEGEKSDLLIADLVITTEDAIKLIKAGLREVSLGYDAQYEQIKPGLGKQMDIIGNHVALVVKGRAGNRCAIMDTACKCCGKCNGNDNLNCKEDAKEMGKARVKDVLHRMFPKLNLDSIKDEDLELGGESTEGGSEVEVAQKAAEEAKNAAIQAVEAAKQAAESAEKVASEGNAAEPMNEETPDDEPVEGEGMEAPAEEISISALASKIDALTSLVQQLVDAVSEESEGGEESIGDEGELEKKKEDEEFVGDEDEEKKEDEEFVQDGEENEKIAEELSKGEAMTADSAWRAAVSRADIIAPGIAVRKPKSSEVRKSLTILKRQALSQGLTKDHASIIKPLLRGKKIHSLTGDALDTVFVAASEMIGKINDAKVQRRSMQMRDLSSYNDLAKMNARNKEFWTKK